MRITTERLADPRLLAPLAAALAVAGPAISVSAGMWDAVSHVQKEPESFWSAPHIVVYVGVALTSCAALAGLLLRASGAAGRMGAGIWLVAGGAITQVVAGYADSISHDIFGIDGLVSWSHQPLEAGLVASALGAVLLARRSSPRLLPAAALSFIFLAAWLAFNLALYPGRVLLCLPVYEVFGSGCAIL
ncbi:MAG: hypothetical protein MPI95_06555 [Nitrosopumilus sp.]|nr:hypothetical protein [Nitrosopumilus sp.]CAI9832415.1 conserved membrane hypothetical protein [Nitrosopumilaceae archaeon]MDA7942045.1 hypothetical protein [Nitrosopumilus sp.]MDA7943083.1 hypothetical protein [Nitrosopumilus sp.]MDA7945175.1 hypothetical protein [Nitrosopumilus sp.]